VRCIELLEGFFVVLSDSSGPIAGQYRDELRKFVGEHNLRYEISEQCKLSLSIPGMLASQYSRLRHELSSNTNLADALLYLEESLSHLKDITHEERNCVALASNLIEG